MRTGEPLGVGRQGGPIEGEETSTAYKYKAFISYSSSDRHSAEKLQRALERYRLPRKMLHSRKYIPRRISPIFLDRSDLRVSPDLGIVIEEALEKSEFLLVLCSPDAAASRWVKREVSYFKSLGRFDKVISVILRGVPAAHDPEREPMGAFPRELLSSRDDGTLVEPLAADLQERGDGFDLAKLKIVATILGVSLAELTQRQLEDDRRRRRFAQAVAAGMVSLAAVATAGAWIAWKQSASAEMRLQTAVETAARQIGATTKYRDRYGVPTDVMQELLTSAERDFNELMSQGRTSSMLVFHRVRLNLEFAELFNIVGGENERKLVSLITDSKRDLDWLTQRSLSVLERIGFSSAPSSASLALLRLKLYDIQAKERSRAGKFPEAVASAQASIALSRQWLAQTGKPDWLRAIAQGHCRVGYLNYQLGELSASATEYQRCIDMTRLLLRKRKDPSDRADLRTAASELATTLVEMDRRSEALALQREALATARSLVASDAWNTEHSRTVLVTATRLADMIMSVEMNLAEAQRLYREALLISDKLTKGDVSRIDWQRDRAILLERSASANLRAADSLDRNGAKSRLHEATQLVREAMQIVDRLLTIDPLNHEWWRDRSVLEERMGQVAFAIYKIDGDIRHLQSSLAWYAKALGDRRAILKRAPGSRIGKLDLAVALIQTGEAQAELPNGSDAALRLLEEALGILEELTRAEDAQTIWLRELGKARAALADVYVRKGDIVKAQLQIQMAMDIIRRLRDLFPKISQYQQDELFLIAKSKELSRIRQQGKPGPSPQMNGN